MRDICVWAQVVWLDLTEHRRHSFETPAGNALVLRNLALDWGHPQRRKVKPKIDPPWLRIKPNQIETTRTTINLTAH